MRTVVIGTKLGTALLVPVLAVAPNPLVLGAIYGMMFVFAPTWDAVVGTYRLSVVPDRLQGRVQSVHWLVSMGVIPLASLAAGFSLEAVGPIGTIFILSGIMTVVAISAIVSPAVRSAPTVAELVAAPIDRG